MGGKPKHLGHVSGNSFPLAQRFMIGPFRKWLGGAPKPESADQQAPAGKAARPAAGANLARLPAGERAYAIGDIHGRLDLFEALIAAIEADDARRNAALPQPARTSVILLGDLIDRGPHSAQVLARARAWQAALRERQAQLHILIGNHEEMLLEAAQRLPVLREFVNYGGKETILSFGITPETYQKATWEELQAMLRAAIEPEWRGFIETFQPSLRMGDYLFVHAGIKPDRPLDQQNPSDLRWIREPFLSSTADHGAVVVHGHTITQEPVLRANRIGIDTGAYQSGRLTALALEGAERHLLVAHEMHGNISTSQFAI